MRKKCLIICLALQEFVMSGKRLNLAELNGIK